MQHIEIKISERQKKILTLLALSDRLSPQQVQDVSISRSTFARDMEELITLSFVTRTGKGRGTEYTQGQLFFLAPLNVDYFFSFDQSKRKISVKHHDVFGYFSKAFSKEEIEELNQLAQTWRHTHEEATPAIRAKEFERLTIELAWKSSQIEGNTYTLLDTERLIKEKKEAKGHTHDEAIMILNHKHALEYIQLHAQLFRQVSKREIENLHSILLEGLPVNKGLRKSPVGIVGTDYRPHDNIFQIEEELQHFLKVLHVCSEIIPMAFTALASIAYIQPFEDGNKRTSRMLANAILMASIFPPLSYRSIDEVEYKKAVVIAYESNNIHYLKKLFIEQFKQASRYSQSGYR